MSRARRIAAMIAAPLLVTAVTLGVVEVLFRLLFTVTDVPLYQGDRVLGYRRAPDQSGRYLSGSSVHGAFAFNAQGWNHRGDYRVARDSGVRRIALIGDSQVEALQVRPEETMSAVAERRMSAGGRRVEWLPFGVSGYGTSQELDVLRHHALAYEPDVVVLLFVQNDPFDTSPYLSEIEPFVTTYALDDRGSLVARPPSESWHASWTYRLAARSAVGRYFIFQRHLPERIGALLHGGARADGGRGKANPFPLRLARKPSATRADERRTWVLIERLLAAARNETERRGARFAVAFRGAPEQIDSAVSAPAALPSPDADPNCLGARMEAMGPQCLEPIVRRLGVAYLDLTGPLRDAVARSRESHRFSDDIHYRAPAHAAAGEALAAFADSLLGSGSLNPSGAEGR